MRATGNIGGTAGWMGVWLAGFMACGDPLLAQLDFEMAPINYGKEVTSDRIAKLAESLDSGQVRLEFDAQHGWLPSMLKQLDVPVESQVLVFSKTSFQLHKIGPSTPRAIYFNDDVYVGWCRNGDVVELGATDAHQGAIFYTLDQDGQRPPKILRDQGQCLACHATNRTQGVPGYLVRSVFADLSGRPRGGTRTFVTDHNSPFDERWGGWYVSGLHGAMRHMGNVRAQDRLQPEDINRDEGANVKSLDKLIDTEPYLSPHSDLVALMVLEHQTQMHNLIARANYEARTAEFYDRGINEALGRPLETVSESTQRRIASVGEALVRYMLFADEAKLTNPINGTSLYRQRFSRIAERDSQGRSLRDFDLETRMFKFPCSYLIYSQAFDSLPLPVMQYVRKRISDILLRNTRDEKYGHLSSSDRQSIVQILLQTKPGFLDGAPSS